MNGRERIMATVQGLPVDRRAVILNLSIYGSRLTGRPLSEHYHNSLAFADGQSAVLKAFAPDALIGPFCLSVQAEAMGSVAKYYPNQAPNVKHHVAQNAEAVLGLPLPQPGASDRLDFVIESIRLMAQRHGTTTPIIAPLLSPLDLPVLLMGFEAWMDTMLFAPELASRIARYLTPCVRAYANALIAAGADILVMPMSFTSPAIVPGHVVKDVSVPILREFLTGLQGPVVLHHGGVPMLPFVPYAKGLPMVVGLGMDEQDNLHEARKQIGPEAVLLAGPLGPSLSTLSPQAVLDHCDRLLQDRQGDPRFILYSSAADISLETPPENIAAFAQAAIKAGVP